MRAFIVILMVLNCQDTKRADTSCKADCEIVKRLQEENKGLRTAYNHAVLFCKISPP